jgi:predicted RNA-binding protein with PIN domain
VDELDAGAVCAVTGLSRTFPGQGLGIEPASRPPALEPVLAYRVILPEGSDPHAALGQFRKLQEEDPQLSVSWEEQSKEIRLSLMGAVQLEILSQQILDRFGLAVAFDAGQILYRETITEPVIGVGHFEPLKHYAEVHLLMEPGPRGSGLKLATSCPEDILAGNWQRLILSHLAEREHPGVLTGAPITDMKITLLTGRAHNKHTEGGDFRQATYRAVRQGLMQAKSLLLEPWYSFRLELPNENVGRAMTDLQRMTAQMSLPEGDGERTMLSGSAPVAVLQDYAGIVTGYTRGLGRLSMNVMGFAVCHNQAEAIAASGYDHARDLANPADSVFCSHGSGFVVPWEEAKAHMHLESGYQIARTEVRKTPDASPAKAPDPAKKGDPYALDNELMAIYERTYGTTARKDVLPRPRKPRPPEYKPAGGTVNKERRAALQGPEYLLVDGYNIIHAWDDLSKVAKQNLDAARQLLMDILSNYRGVREREIILVFDAYKVPGGIGSVTRYHNISVVYTKEAETADAYIEKVTYDIGKKYRVSVATSDGAIQYIILGHGALRITPSALRTEIELVNADVESVIASNNSRGFGQRLRIPEA